MNLEETADHHCWLATRRQGDMWHMYLFSSLSDSLEAAITLITFIIIIIIIMIVL
jgi:hypothetical protein